MKATQIEFRLRYLTHALIYILGFSAPYLFPSSWWLQFGSKTTWVTLAFQMTKAGWMSFSLATQLVLILGTLCALTGAVLRTWGASYLGSGVVKDSAMHGDRMLADGPYRYLRNPLYLGTIFSTLALAMLMVPLAAAITVVLIVIEQLRLIGAEEAFLTEKLGEPYLRYKEAVPSLVPSVSPKIAAGGAKPHWLQGALGELYFIGVAVTFASLGWSYNGQLLIRGVVISFGLSLITRAFVAS